LREFRHVQDRYVSEVINLGPFFGPSSKLYARTQEINYTVVCMTLDFRERSLFHYVDVKKLFKSVYDWGKQCKKGNKIGDMYKNI